MILYKLHQYVPSTPMNGFSIERITWYTGSLVSMEIKSIKIEIATWDIGSGKDNCTDYPIWKCFLQESEGFVYVAI